MAEAYVKVSGDNEANVKVVAATLAALVPGENEVVLPEIDPVTLEVSQVTYTKCKTVDP